MFLDTSTEHLLAQALREIDGVLRICWAIEFPIIGANLDGLPSPLRCLIKIFA